MSSSNEIQPNPKKISSLQETETPVPEEKSTLEISNTTPNNINNSATIDPNKEADNHNGSNRNRRQQGKRTGILDFLLCNRGNDSSSSQTKDSSNRGSDSSFIHFQRVQKSKNNLEQIEAYFSELEKVPEFVRLDRLKSESKRLKDMLDKVPISKIAGRLPEIHKEIMKFKQQISSLQKLSKNLSQSADLKTSNGSNGHSAVDGLVNVHSTDSFIRSSFYKEIEVIFNDLDLTKQFLLSCFAVLPENAVVHRRLLIYWGVGEGFIFTDKEKEKVKTPEKIVDGFLEEFEEKGLIEPVLKKRKLKVKSYKMDPLVRSAVIKLSESEERKFFAYDSKGNVVANPSMTDRACLLKKEEESSSEQEQQLQKANSFQYSNQENLITLFNVNEPFPDLELALLTKRKDSNTPKRKDSNADQTNGSNSIKMKDPNAVEWLSKMKKAKVVCLGSWPGSAKSHVEVEDIDFLKALANMKELKFLSLQGIFRITKLPSSIGMLSNLFILDLKECHNLEELSEEITKLTNLRYLDLSECYLLAHMPKGLSELSHLQVLKGFVISTSTDENKMGTISDLKGLQNLRKLTINASSEDFPKQKDLDVLNVLGKQALRKLTIAWSVELKKEPTKQDQTEKAATPKVQQGEEPKPAAKHEKGLKKQNQTEKAATPTVQQGEEPKPAAKHEKGLKKQDQTEKAATPTVQQGEEPKPAAKHEKGLKKQDQTEKAATPTVQQGEEPKPAAKHEKGLKRSETKMSNPDVVIDKLPKELKKLDLQCFPKSTSKWLTPEALPNLKKLYIRGGNLATLDRMQWSTVKTLRLKFLRELKMTWIELKDTFPDLVYLEKVNCPRISLCPCDENGVWMKPDDHHIKSSD